MLEEKLIAFLKESDMDFFENHILKLPIEEQRIFWEDNPTFLSEYLLSIEELDALQNKEYRDMCRELKELSKEL